MNQGEKQEILFIAPCLRSGGAERVMVLLANELVKKDKKVRFAFTMDTVQAYTLDEKIDIIINDGNRSPLGQIIFLRTLLKAYKYSTFISFFTYQNIYTLIANSFLGRKIVVSERNDPAKTVYGKKSMIFLRNIFYNFASKIVFQTQEAMEYFSMSIQKRGCIICNPLNSELCKIYEGEKEKRIVAVARLNKQKNLPMMLKGVSTILKKYKEYVFELYGESDPRAESIKPQLEELVFDLEICNQVKFMGFQSDVTDKISKAALYINSSDYEGISNAMLEAIALGIPCVCTDCPVGGARMFIRDGINGYLVSVGDEKGFELAIEKVLVNKDIYASSRKEGKNLRERLSVDKIIGQWLDIL